MKQRIIFTNAGYMNSFEKTALISPDTFKGAVSRNSAKLGNYKMPVKLRET